MFFPLYQKRRGKEKWTLFYPAALSLALSLPLFLMDGTVRPALAIALFLFAGYLLWRQARNGWRVEAAVDDYEKGLSGE